MNRMEKRYNRFNDWLKAKFGERTLKICIDGGFTCPNRDGTKGYGGCSFCGERGSGENTKRTDVSAQVRDHLASYKAARANKFIAYFQNFSNTYESIDKLKEKYDGALIDDRIVALAVATRPDCITKEVVDLLKSYLGKYYVYVELGLQTANEEVASKFNRGYSNAEFAQATKMLASCGIDVVAHLMIGLPYEQEGDLTETVNFINSLPVTGVKIHSTYIIKGTELEELYTGGEYEPLTLERYVDGVCYVLAHLKPETVICRITGDAPKDKLVEPKWNARKKPVLNAINKALEKRDVRQGNAFKKNS